MNVPPRYSTREAGGRLGRLLSLDKDDYMQDWPLEVADPGRLMEFCDAYEYERFGPDDDIRFVLMELILYSLDETAELQSWLANPAAELEAESLAVRVARLLERDFVLHLHTANYWRLADKPDIENVFALTPLTRHVWEKCYRPEYAQWLAVVEA